MVTGMWGLPQADLLCTLNNRCCWRILCIADCLKAADLHAFRLCSAAGILSTDSADPQSFWPRGACVCLAGSRWGFCDV